MNRMVWCYICLKDVNARETVPMRCPDGVWRECCNDHPGVSLLASANQRKIRRRLKLGETSDV